MYKWTPIRGEPAPTSQAMSVPDTQIGLIRDEDGTSHLKTFPVPEPGTNEVLIRNVAVASNPKDWKAPMMVKDFTYIEGSDVAGEIVKLGEGVTGLKVGQRVAAFLKMMSGNKVCSSPRWINK